MLHGNTGGQDKVKPLLFDQADALSAILCNSDGIIISFKDVSGEMENKLFIINNEYLFMWYHYRLSMSKPPFYNTGKGQLSI